MVLSFYTLLKSRIRSHVNATFTTFKINYNLPIQINSLLNTFASGTVKLSHIFNCGFIK